ncbi:hypothetical protein [Nonomuraea sp. SYSU D8015]|nr:hypothetical protein [Nonomuraea sp. SYSU D8015]
MEPVPVRPKHGAGLTEHDRDPAIHIVDELELPEWVEEYRH